MKMQVIAKWFPEADHIDYQNPAANEARKRNQELR